MTLSQVSEREQNISGPPSFRAFAHVSVPCRDIEEGKLFYSKVLGGNMHVETPTFASFRLCGVDVGIGTDGCT
jgi:catechol 2,3-dioxygenase-like lactoylglutathione lyase family enzyme